MGKLISKACCLSNIDIINNQNYSNSFGGNNSGIKNSNLLKSEKERLPLIQINLKDTSPELSVDLPITSKNVIVRKDYSPLVDYEILSILGEGTYGIVFMVKNKESNLIGAMKQISKYNLSNIGQNRIMEEIEILKNLNHIYIIKLYEYYVTDDFIFLINELSSEGDLQRKLVKIKKFPEFIVKIIMFQIFQALMYLNEKNIIHGDLKLENILVINYNSSIKEKNKNKKEDGFIEAIKHDMKIINENLNYASQTGHFKKSDLKFINDLDKNLKRNQIIEEKKIFRNNFILKNHLAEKTEKFNNIKEKNEDINNRKQMIQKSNTYIDRDKLYINNFGIKLIDFGCSKIFTRTKKHFSDIIGTLVYCSPEVLFNDYNKTCDIWSCGVIMYYLLSGEFPFVGENEEETTNKILKAKFEFDVEHFNHISTYAKDLIRKCLKKEPKKRIKIQDALNHPFFNDLKNVEKENLFTEEERKRLKSLKDLNRKSKFFQIVLTYLSYHFSDYKLLDQLNQLYKKLDTNTDYKISKTELYNAYKSANIKITKKELEDMINSMDFNINGDIDYEEFIRMCLPKEKLFTENNLKNAFLIFDTDKKGFITPQTIVNFIETTQQMSEDLKLQIKKEIADIADEIIDIDDFKTFMLNFSKSEKE